MKTLLLFGFIMYAGSCFSQSVTSGSGTNPLHKPNVLTQSQTDVNNSLYQLTFLIADLTALTSDSGSQTNACILTDANGTVYSGTPATSPSSQLYACSFTKEELSKIGAQKITKIEIINVDGNESSFSTDQALQINIAAQIKTILIQ